MRGGKKKRVKRLHTDTLFSSGKITKLFHQELTSFICDFHSGLSTEWFANYTYPLEMAMAVSCSLSGWWTVCLVHPHYILFFFIKKLHRSLRAKRCLATMAWAVPQEMSLQVLLLSRLLVWSFPGDLGLDSGKDEGLLSPGRTSFQPLLNCQLPSAP